MDSDGTHSDEIKLQKDSSRSDITKLNDLQATALPDESQRTTQPDSSLPHFIGVKHILLILSGKGGVGKSSVTTQTALALSSLNLNVAVLDTDLTGPSLPRFFNVEGHPILQSEKGYIPTKVYPATSKHGSLSLISLGLLAARDLAIVWRGPKKTSIIKQLIRSTYWGNVDYLLIDTPPGTSDEHIALAEELRDAGPIDGAIIVTTPQQVSIADVRKEINFCRKVKFDIVGIVENMSGFVCPHCTECTDIFLAGGGKSLSEQLGIDFLGSLPIDPTFGEMIETQTLEKTLVDAYQDSPLQPLMTSIVAKVLEKKLPSRI